MLCIVGCGAAGLAAALESREKKIVIIDGKGAASAISPWNMQAEQGLKEKMLNTGKINNREILDYFIENYSTAKEFLEKHNIKLRKSNMGIIPNYRMVGKELTEIFRKKLIEKGVKIVEGNVKGIRVKGDKLCSIVVNSKEIYAENFIFAFGGLGNLYKYSTYVGAASNLLAACLEAGFEIGNLQYNMFHPFLIIDKKLPNTLLSGTLLQKMRFINSQNKEFLSEEIIEALKNNKYHYLFSKMCREFYAESLKNKIYAEILLNENEFNEYKQRDEFGWIFANRKLSEIRRFRITPAFHYSLGGLTIDRNAKTSFENVYAAGECTTGLHGCERVGGVAIAEAIIFGITAAKNANNGKLCRKGKLIKIPEIDEKHRQLFWELLGPIKRKKKLETFIDENKRTDDIYIKLALKAAELSLDGNLGLNYVID
ncbi:MAG: FAD-binding protein [Candidatus Diapherotrites archaeon]|nr:FAD-binding protein [Candidatus Diapherotrites archaeon]